MFKKILLVLFVLTVAFGSSLQSQAIEFKSGEDISVSEPANNLHLAGSKIDIKSDTKRDLVVAGAEVNITGKVERNILAAAGTLRINSPEVGGTIRAAGGEVYITGNFKDDLVIAGGKVELDNVNIEGDLVVASDSFTLVNSKIKGNVYGSYNQLNGDIKAQTLGKVELSKTQVDTPKEQSFLNSIDWVSELNTIVALLIISLILYKNNKLQNNAKFDSKFGFDILIGLGVLIIPVIAVIASLFFFMYPITILIASILYLVYVISFFFLPIYLANWFKNTFEFKFDLRYIVAFSYVLLFALGLLSRFVPAVSVIVFIYSLANLGFILKWQFGLYKGLLK